MYSDSLKELNLTNLMNLCNKHDRYGKKIFKERNAYKEICDKLKESQIIAINGISGSGKTWLALYYTFTRQEYFNITYFIGGDTMKNLEDNFIDFSYKLARTQGIAEISYNLGLSKLYEKIHEGHKINIETAKSFIKFILSYENIKFILIFDGIDNEEIKSSLESYFPELSNNSLKFIIITTQNKNFYQDKRQSLSVDKIEEKIVTELLEDIPQCQCMTDDDKRFFSNKFSHIILGIVTARIYLINNPNISIKDYLNLLELECSPESSLRRKEDELMSELYIKKRGARTVLSALRVSIKNIKNDEARNILLLCSFVSHVNIRFELLLDYFKLTKNLSDAALKGYVSNLISDLEENSLISQERNSLFTHEVVQKAAHSLLEREEKMKFLIILINIFYNLFNFTPHDSQHWNVHKKHIKNILHVIFFIKNTDFFIEEAKKLTNLLMPEKIESPMSLMEGSNIAYNSSITTALTPSIVNKFFKIIEHTAYYFSLVQHDQKIAMDLYQYFLMIYDLLQRNTPMNLAVMTNKLAHAHRLQHNYKDAIFYFKESLKIKKQNGASVGEIVINLIGIGSMNAFNKNIEKAIDYYNKAIKKIKKSPQLGVNNYRVAIVLSFMANAFLKNDCEINEKIEKVESCLDQATDIIKNNYFTLDKPYHFVMTMIYHLKACLTAIQEKHDETIVNLRLALENEEKVHPGQGVFQIAICRYILGKILILKDWKEATSYLNLALSDIKKLYDKDQEIIGKINFLLSQPDNEKLIYDNSIRFFAKTLLEEVNENLLVDEEISPRSRELKFDYRIFMPK